MKKNTDDLRQELMDSPNLDKFLSDNQSEFISRSVAMHLSELCQAKHISKSTLAKRSCISEVYLHQIFAGRRSPSRNRLLCLCFGLEATVDETQSLLRFSGLAQLYPKDQRDAMIQHAMIHGTPLMELNQTLFNHNLETLF